MRAVRKVRSAIRTAGRELEVGRAVGRGCAGLFTRALGRDWVSEGWAGVFQGLGGHGDVPPNEVFSGVQLWDELFFRAVVEARLQCGG